MPCYSIFTTHTLPAGGFFHWLNKANFKVDYVEVYRGSSYGWDEMGWFVLASSSVDPWPHLKKGDMKTVQIGKGPKSFDVVKYEEKANKEFFLDWDGDEPVADSTYGRCPGDFPNPVYASPPEQTQEIYTECDYFEEQLKWMLAFVQSLK